jgi:arginase family enzyme
MGNRVWFRTDEAWDFIPDAWRGELPAMDVRDEARGVRFITSAARIETFAARHAKDFRPFTLFGSGDFHHLSAVWMRQFQEPFTLLSFDNHPDWDIRPPHWSCGAWINRALESPFVRDVGIWGCGNYECNFPGRLLGNRSASRAGRLRVHPWAQEGVGYPDWLSPIRAETWKSQFVDWVKSRAGRKIYVTVDMDCLASGEAVTNWENGRFTCEDLVWALGAARESAEIIGGDLCGAWSRQEYATGFQKLAGWFDHPKVVEPTEEELAAPNLRVLEKVWPALIGEGNLR